MRKLAFVFGAAVAVSLAWGGAAAAACIDCGPPTVAGPVPEPATWAMMIMGFAVMGLALRRRRVAVTA